MGIALPILALGCLAVVPVLLFLIVVQPLWAFFEFGTAALLGRGWKILGLLFLLVFWVVASIPYALFMSASGALRRITFLSLLLLAVVGGGAYGFLSLNPGIKERALKHVEDASKTYDSLRKISELARDLPRFALPGR